VDDLAQVGVVPPVAVAAEGHVRGGDAERTHGVPHTDELDAHLARFARAERDRSFVVGRDTLVAIQIVRPRDAGFVRRVQDAAFAYQPDQAARGVGAAAEAEDVDLVARLVFLREPPVSLPDVLRESPAEGAAGDLVVPVRADSRVVETGLRRVVRAARDDGLAHANDVGPALPIVPVAVEENAQFSGHLLPPSGGKVRSIIAPGAGFFESRKP